MVIPLTLEEAGANLRAGRTTAVALVEDCLAAIARDNARTNAFIRVEAESARAAAEAADTERLAGHDRGPLHGLPISVKDLIDIAGLPTTAASKAIGETVADVDAPLVTRLRGAGAILVGKTNLHEFALGTTSEDSAFGPVRHPADADRVAGGSSGGSAVAVATGMSLASIGTDTGGSIRIPAAACGTVGLKPTRGEVPLAGVVPLSTSLDHAGPLTRSVQDAAMVWAVLADQPALRVVPSSPRALTLKRLTGYYDAPLETTVRRAFDAAMGALGQAGVSILSHELEGADAITDTYVHIVLAEAAHWHAALLQTRREAYTPRVGARIASGADISAVAYLRARDHQVQLTCLVDAALETCDALILPTLPIVAPAIGQDTVTFEDPEATMDVRSAMLKHTRLFNLTGHPAITLPVPSGGLPVGVQLVGRRNATAHLLSVAAACEKIVGSVR